MDDVTHTLTGPRPTRPVPAASSGERDAYEALVARRDRLDARAWDAMCACCMATARALEQARPECLGIAWTRHDTHAPPIWGAGIGSPRTGGSLLMAAPGGHCVPLSAASPAASFGREQVGALAEAIDAGVIRRRYPLEAVTVLATPESVVLLSALGEVYAQVGTPNVTCIAALSPFGLAVGLSG